MVPPRVRGTVLPRPTDGRCVRSETMRSTSPSFCQIEVSWESQRVDADSTSVSRTLGKSKVARLMTLSTSAVAVCCWSDSDQIIVLEHGDAEQRACAGRIREFDGGRIAIEISLT